MREIYTARLEQKLLLSAVAECYHLHFRFMQAEIPAIAPGQFLSLLAEDEGGKTYTRAYSVASAPQGPGFDICVNRVPGGFFSNLLCDLSEGDLVRCHGPHGLFTLRQPLVDSLMVAAGTGIAPIRSFVQWLFSEPEPGERGGTNSRTEGRQCWLIYEAPEPEQLFYNNYFRQMTAVHANFHYIPLLNPGNTREQMEQALAPFAARAASGPELPTAAFAFDRYAYICGLAEMVKPTRAYLQALGWSRQQILFERYD